MRIRQIIAAAGTVILLGGSFFVGRIVLSQGISDAADVAQLLGVPLASLPMIVSLFVWAKRASTPTPSPLRGGRGGDGQGAGGGGGAGTMGGRGGDGGAFSWVQHPDGRVELQGRAGSGGAGGGIDEHNRPSAGGGGGSGPFGGRGGDGGDVES